MDPLGLLKMSGLVPPPPPHHESLLKTSNIVRESIGNLSTQIVQNFENGMEKKPLLREEAKRGMAVDRSPLPTVAPALSPSISLEFWKSLIF